MQEGFLSREDAVWSRLQDGIGASAWIGKPAADSARVQVIDYRSIGLTTEPLAVTSSPRDAISRGTERALEYSETVDDDGLVVVTAFLPENRSMRWYIDPRLDWNALRVEERVGDTLVRAVLTDYELVGETWVPVRVFWADANGNVDHARDLIYTRVNTPDLPRELTPADIGVLVGMSVTVTDSSGTQEKLWTGGELLPLPEYQALRAAGKVRADPALPDLYRRSEERRARMAARGRLGPTSNPASQPGEVIQSAPQILGERIRLLREPDVDEWQRWVDDAMRKYEFTEQQQNRGRAVLRQSQEERARYLRGKQPQIERLMQRKAAAKSDARLIEDQFRLLSQPIDAMFSRLKERVLRIATPDQRAKAGDQPASRPAGG
ncbi:MAG: hypothetical protein AB1716_15305 [Planctomycetota bacterium]